MIAAPKLSRDAVSSRPITRAFARENKLGQHIPLWPIAPILRSERECRSLLGITISRKDMDMALKIGDKIVWGPGPGEENEEGVVAWVGMIEGVKTTGIIFKNQVGNCNGFATDGKRHFQCPPNHGRFVAITEFLSFQKHYGCIICDKHSRSLHSMSRCGHLFHADCLEKTRKELSNTCPVCKKTLPTAGISSLFNYMI